MARKWGFFEKEAWFNLLWHLWPIWIMIIAILTISILMKFK